MSAKRPQFSLAMLIGLVCVSALAFAAIASESPVWSGLLFGLAVCVMMVAIVGAIYSREASRAFWVGFAILGWGYLTLAYGPWFNINVRDLLPSTSLAEAIHPKLQRPAPTSVQPQRGILPPITTVGPEFFQIQKAFDSLLAILAAAVGGVTARYFYNSTRDAQAALNKASEATPS